MSLATKIHELKVGPQVQPYQLLELCEQLNTSMEAMLVKVQSALDAQLRMNERLNKLEAAKLYVEPRG